MKGEHCIVADSRVREEIKQEKEGKAKSLSHPDADLTTRTIVAWRGTQLPRAYML